MAHDTCNVAVAADSGRGMLTGYHVNQAPHQRVLEVPLYVQPK